MTQIELDAALAEGDLADALASASDEGLEGADVEAQRDRLLQSVGSAKLDTVLERVAWILSRDKRARDSDVHLLLEYWKAFYGHLYSGGPIHPDLLYVLPRQISVTRARAKIQNTYRLFQASPEIQAARRSLSEEARQKIAAQRPDAPVITVAADESGKDGEFLIVGSVWCLISEQLRETVRLAREFRASRNIKYEFHFNKITDHKLPVYVAFVDEVVRPAAAVSFRAVATKRAGLDTDSALQSLFTHLLLRGVELEHHSGRAPMPRSLEFWKDLDDRNRDKVMLAAVKERMVDASAARFGGALHLEEFSPIDSEGSPLLQIADLFTASLNRRLNVSPDGGSHVKDQFASHLLKVVQLPDGPQTPETVGDMTVFTAL